MLKTASETGIRAGSASRAFCVRTACAGHDEQALQAGRRLEALGVAVAAQHEAAQQRGGDVVRVAFELGRLGQQVGAELEDRVGRHEAGDDRRRARPEPAGERDVRADRELEVVGRVQRREAAHDQVAAVAGDPQVGVDARSGPVSTTSTSMCRSSAAPMTSNPGPRLAEDAGTRTEPVARSHSRTARSTARDVRLARHDRAGLAQRRLRVLEAVAGEHADDALGAVDAVRQQARRPRRPRPARRRRPRWRPGSGRRRGSARRRPRRRCRARW